MVTRRDFLRGTMGGLVGTLLPRKSNASCAGLTLDFYFEPVKGDVVSKAFCHGNEQTKKKIVDELLVPVQEVFSLVGIQVKSGTYGIYTTFPINQGENIAVIYGTKERYLNEGYPTMEDLFHLLKIAYDDDNLVALARKNYSAYHDPVIYERALRKQLYDKLLGKLDGISDRPRKYVGLFSGQWEDTKKEVPRKARPFAYERLYGKILVHELGHVLGLKHAKEARLPSGDEDVMIVGDSIDISDFLEMNYNFSSADQEKLRAAQCFETE